MKKFIAGFMLAGVGLLGTGVAHAVEWPISPLDIQTNNEKDGENFGFYHIAEADGVPMVYFTPVNEGNSTGVVNDILSESKMGDIDDDVKKKMKSAEFKGVGFPATTFAIPSPELMDTWVDMLKDAGFDTSSLGKGGAGNPRFQSILDVINDKVGDKVMDDINSREKEVSSLVFFDRENVKGEGEFVIATLDENGKIDSAKKMKSKDAFTKKGEGKDKAPFEFSGDKVFSAGESAMKEGESPSDIYERNKKFEEMGE